MEVSQFQVSRCFTGQLLSKLLYTSTPRINPHTYIHLIFDEQSKITPWKKDIVPTRRGMKQDPCLLF